MDRSKTVIVLTCNINDSGIINSLEPVGPMTGIIYYCGQGNTFLEKVTEYCKNAFPNADFVFNAKFTFTYNGHPSYGEFDCRITGDVYRYTPDPNPSRQLAQDKHYLVKKS